MSVVKRFVLTAFFIALCIVLPLALHSIPKAGAIFSPIHIPVLLCGMICGWPFGLLCGLAGPAMSSMLTGMPAAANLLPMLVELPTYGVVCGLIMKHIRTRSLYADLYISLVTAMLLGRIVAGLAKALIFAPGATTMVTWATGYFVTSLPAILLQLILIPSIVYALMQARLIPQRYPKD